MGSRKFTEIDIVVDILEDDINPNTSYVVLKKNAFENAKTKCSKLHYILHQKLPTYAVEIMTMLINESNLPHAVLGHRIGLCPIVQRQLTDVNKSVPTRISFKGPGYITSGQCPNMHFASDCIKLCYLDTEDKRVVVDCHFVKGDAEVHAMFNPICNISLYRVNGDHLAFKFTRNGQYSTEELGHLLTTMYNDPDIKVPAMKSNVEGVRYPQDVENVIPRSELTLPY